MVRLVTKDKVLISRKPGVRTTPLQTIYHSAGEWMIWLDTRGSKTRVCLGTVQRGRGYYPNYKPNVVRSSYITWDGVSLWYDQKSLTFEQVADILPKMKEMREAFPTPPEGKEWLYAEV